MSSGDFSFLPSGVFLFNPPQEAGCEDSVSTDAWEMFLFIFFYSLAYLKKKKKTSLLWSVEIRKSLNLTCFFFVIPPPHNSIS